MPIYYNKLPPFTLKIESKKELILFQSLCDSILKNNKTDIADSILKMYKELREIGDQVYFNYFPYASALGLSYDKIEGLSSEEALGEVLSWNNYDKILLNLGLSPLDVLVYELKKEILNNERIA